MVLLETVNSIYANSVEEIKNNFVEVKESEYGSNSTIYFYKKYIYLKVFNEFQTDKELYDLKLLRRLKTKTLTLIRKFLFIKKRFYGYTMDEKSGKMIYQIDLNTRICDLFKALKDVEDDLRLLASNKISAGDLNVLNILYDKKTNTASLIDLDSYQYESEESEECILYHNILKLYLLILHCLSDVYSIKNCNNNMISFMYESILKINNLSLSMDSFFEYFIIEMENELDKEIITVDDFRKSLKMFEG